MSNLTIYDERDNRVILYTEKPDRIARTLASISVIFKQVTPAWELSANPSEAEVLKCYEACIEDIQRTKETPYIVDVKGVNSSTPPSEIAKWRGEFGDEHTHPTSEDRIIVADGGNFLLHPPKYVHLLRVGKNDSLSVPEGMKHGFDYGAVPKFLAIHLRKNEKYVAHHTGSEIFSNLPAYN